MISHGVRDGAVVSGIETLKRCHMYYGNTKGFPAENHFYVVEESLEKVAISGLIADYERARITSLTSIWQLGAVTRRPMWGMSSMVASSSTSLSY